MTKLYFIILSLLLFSCAEKRDCSFTTLDEAVDCACEISNEKEAANGDKELLEKLKNQTKELNDSFEKAIEDSVFTEKEFVAKLKSTCENY